MKNELLKEVFLTFSGCLCPNGTKLASKKAGKEKTKSELQPSATSLLGLIKIKAFTEYS
ncbi:hypothetical protein [Bacteroides zoogleoformans]|uniref:hypothetical protein n=1 Tax=Bacteroides zoogleoformans TaxID=28119 RepID=UPI0013ED10DC|nr:hypothetical protein [Bacteroides zoogleoformans]